MHQDILNHVKDIKISTLSGVNKDGDPFRWSLHMGMLFRFTKNFWGICGSFFLIRKWRHVLVYLCLFYYVTKRKRKKRIITTKGTPIELINKLKD